MRSGLVFQPSVQMPAQTLAMLQLIFRGGMRGNESIDDAIGRHYQNERLTFDHIGSLLEMFDFRRLTKDTHISLSVLVSFILTLHAFFGTRGAFKFWCMLFDFTLSTCRVKHPKGEPVAVLDVYKDPSQYDNAWDSHFPGYKELVFQTLRNMRNQSEIATYMVHAAQGSTYHKDVAHTLAQLMDGETTRSRYNVSASSGGALPYGAYEIVDDTPVLTQTWAARGVTDGLLGDVLKANRGALTIGDREDTTGDKPTRTARHAWGAALDHLSGSQWLQKAPIWPVDGQTSEILDRLHAQQEYGAEREQTLQLPSGKSARVRYVHKGLDLPAKEGTPIRSPWAGMVTRVVDDWQESDKGKPEKSRGNYIRAVYGTIPGQQLPGGARMVVDYLHLSETAAELGEVAAGETIGAVGTTGNSSGPHLHFEARWELPTAHGRADRSWVLDPETLLTEGPIAAAREAGAPVLPDEPSLGGALWMLETIVSPASAAPAGYGGALDALMSWLKPALEWADDVAEEAGEQLQDILGDELYDDVRDAVISTTDTVLDWSSGPGRGVVTSLASAFGLGDHAGTVIDVLDTSWDAGKASNYTDSNAMFEAGLREAFGKLKASGIAEDKAKELIQGLRNSNLQDIVFGS